MNFGPATLHYVSNRGTPPATFLQMLVTVGNTLPAEVTAPNTERDDVFSTIHDALGSWQGEPDSPERALHRLAVMLEILRVLAGFESAWNWSEGRDTTNPTENDPETESAGAFQISYNSRAFGDDLRKMIGEAAILGGTQFQAVTKANPPFAIQYAARILRHTTKHNGPVKRHEIHPWLRKDAVEEFKALLTVK